MKPKVIFIHGNGGSTADENWFPSLKKELEKLSLQVLSRTFPDNHLARQAYWLPFLEEELLADENTILIGHSSGAVAAYALRRNKKNLCFSAYCCSLY